MLEQKDCVNAELSMENMPLITIAIPAYKTEFLAQAIQSALAQTYSKYEILVVDDCSPNDVKAVVDSFSDERITYYRNEVNLGKNDPSRNWQRCLELARGEYICILCDDDIYGPEYLQTLVNLARRYPSCSAFRCGVSEIDDQGRVCKYYPLAPEYSNVEEYIWHYFSRKNHQTMSEWMLKTSSLKAMGGYVACPVAWGSDCSTIYMLAEHGGIVSSPSRLMCFRQSKVNITGQRFRFIPQKVLGWQHQCRTALEIMDKSKHPDREMIVRVVDHEYKKGRRNLFKRASAWDLCSMLRHRQKYGLSIPFFILMMLRNPLWHIIAKRKK